MSARVSALSILQEQYPQQLRISLSDASRWIGIRPGTARNRLCAGTFPVPTVRFGDLRLVDIRDLAEYLDRSSSGDVPVSSGSYIDSRLGISTPAGALASTPEPGVPAPRRQRGRPRKVGVSNG